MKVFEFEKQEQWESFFIKQMRDIKIGRVIKRFLLHPPEYVVSDDMSWLENLIEAETGRLIDFESYIYELILKNIQAVRAAHACRPVDINNYYDNGLMPLNCDEAKERFKQIFNETRFPALANDLVDAAISSVEIGVRDERTFFELNEKLLLNGAGHYLIYGSEYFIGIAAALGDFAENIREYTRDYRQELKNHGIPTMFICHVPTSMISRGTIIELGRTCIATIFDKLIGGDPRERWRAFGFSIKQVLPPQYIKEHYHPAIVRDPLQRGAIYHCPVEA